MGWAVDFDGSCHAQAVTDFARSVFEFHLFSLNNVICIWNRNFLLHAPIELGQSHLEYSGQSQKRFFNLCWIFEEKYVHSPHVCASEFFVSQRIEHDHRREVSCFKWMLFFWTLKQHRMTVHCRLSPLNDIHVLFLQLFEHFCTNCGGQNANRRIKSIQNEKSSYLYYIDYHTPIGVCIYIEWTRCSPFLIWE